VSSVQCRTVVGARLRRAQHGRPPLYESTVRFRSYPGVLSGILGLRPQAYEYFTVIPNRYAVSLSLINGTGNIVPAGY
jgi:hypothetical protein